MHFKCERQPRVTNCAFDQTNSFYLVKSAVYDVGQQGSSTAKRKCLHFEASVQCDRGTGAHGVCKGGETALFAPDVVSRHIKKAQHIMLRVF